MGGDLRPAAGKGKSPSFIVTALSDPMGATLDRVQMIKGWRDRQGNLHEKVYDIAWSETSWLRYVRHCILLSQAELAPTETGYAQNLSVGGDHPEM